MTTERRPKKRASFIPLFLPALCCPVSPQETQLGLIDGREAYQ